MPLLTRASAADLTRSSVTLHAKRFQLFQPMGGVRARPLSRARADGAHRKNPKNKESARRFVSLAKFSMRSSQRTLVFFYFTQQRQNCPRSPGARSSRPTSGRTTKKRQSS